MDMGNGEWVQYADQVDIDGYKYENVKYVHHADGTATIQNPDGTVIDGTYVGNNHGNKIVEYNDGNRTVGISYSCNCKRYEVYKNDDGTIYQRNEYDTVGRPTYTTTNNSDGSTSTASYNNDGSVRYTSITSSDGGFIEIRSYPDGREINGFTPQQIREGTVPYE